MEEKKLPW